MTIAHNYYLWACPYDDSKKIQKKIAKPTLGVHTFSRLMKSHIQALFHHYYDASDNPKVLLQGNPHIENYVKTNYATGLNDFDRSLIGPFSWDLVCLLLSAQLYQESGSESILSESITDALQAGYMSGLQQTLSSFTLYTPLSLIGKKSDPTTTRDYIQKQKKWVKRMRKFPLSTTDPFIVALLDQYQFNLNKPLNHTHRLSAVSRAYGTFGRKRFIYLLSANDTQDDDILLEIKETRDYRSAQFPHYHQYYYDPFDHKAKRIMRATDLYAPGSIALQSYAMLQGIEYGGRQIPIYKHGLSQLLNANQLHELVYAIGSQLGHGHHLYNASQQTILIQAVNDQWSSLKKVAAKLCKQVVIAWYRYCQMKVDHK